MQIVNPSDYQLVGKIPESNAFGEGMKAMMQRKERVNTEAMNREHMRQAGTLSQLQRIKDPEQYKAYMAQLLQAEKHPAFRADLEKMASMDMTTAQNMAAQAVRGVGLGRLLPGESVNGGRSWDAGEIVKQVGQDENGKPLFQRFTITKTLDDSGNQQLIETPIGNPTADMSQLPGALENYSKSYGSQSGANQADISQGGELGDIKATTAGKEAEAKAGVELKHAYDIAFQQARAKAQQSTMQANAEAMNGLEQLQPLFSMADEALGSPAGFYAGNIMDSIKSGILPVTGFVLDQDKLNNTTNLRMALTNLKVGAKPTGAGNPVASEWEMYAQTIPDPMLASPGQLRSAYSRYKQLVQDKYRQLGSSQRSIANPSSAPQNIIAPERQSELDKKYGLE